MAERPSGYYWVRYRTLTIIAHWSEDGESWLYNAEFYAPSRFTVLYGPIPGPEELRLLTLGEMARREVREGTYDLVPAAEDTGTQDDELPDDFVDAVRTHLNKKEATNG